MDVLRATFLVRTGGSGAQAPSAALLGALRVYFCSCIGRYLDRNSYLFTALTGEYVHSENL